MDYYSQSFTDHEGKDVHVRWTKKVWDGHLNKHPEIKSREFASGLILETLTKPSLVMDGRREGDGGERTRCYYKEHKRNKMSVYFTKVTVGCNSNPYYVKTVFVQKYPNFKEIWQDPKTYL